MALDSLGAGPLVIVRKTYSRVYRDPAEMRHDPARAPEPRRDPGRARGGAMAAMRDQAIGQPDVSSLALAEPTRHVRRRWILGLTLASLGMWMANQTPLQVMLALQLQDITPRHKIVALGVVTGVGAIASALATPVVGALSDRTAHGGRLGRFSGRRHRWTLVMAVLAAACMVLLAEQAMVLGVALLWFAFSAFQNGEYATLSAAIPDHVPVRQRATVAGWVGMPIALGLVLGTILVVDVLGQILVTVSGLLMAAAALLLAFQETWPAALAAAVLYGTGYGCYIAVDQALITQVLPKARDRARDLGIINIAIVCPGAIGAVIAAPLVSLAGYPALFGATAVVAIAASIGVWRIKSVR